MNLASIIDGHDDDRVAVISRGRPTTYGELRRQVAGLRMNETRSCYESDSSLRRADEGGTSICHKNLAEFDSH